MKSAPRLSTVALAINAAIFVCLLSGCAGHLRPRTEHYTDPLKDAEAVATRQTNKAVSAFELPKLSLSQSLTEIAFDGRFAVPANSGPVKADAHSILYLQFPFYVNSPTTNSADADPKWKPVLALLEFLEQTAVRMQEINARKIDPSNPNQLQRLQRDAAEVAGTSADLIRKLLAVKELDLDQDEIADIILGNHSSLAAFPRATNGYVNLGRWLTVELQKRRDEFQALVTNKQVKVTVHAFRESNGAKSALHVDGWDSFAEGAYRPIDRTGLRPTEAEQARLNVERQQAEGTKRLVESVIAKDGSLKQALKAKFKELEQKLGQLVDQLRGAGGAWPLEHFRALTNTLATLAVADTQGPAARLIIDVKTFYADFVEAKALVDSGAQLVDRLKNLNKANPEEIMFGATSVFAQAGAVFQSFTNVAARVPTFPDRLRRIQEALPVVGDAVVVKQQTTNVLQSITGFVQSLGENFSTRVRELEIASVKATNGVAVVQATDAVDKPEGDWIPRTLDDLVPGRLDLKRSGLALDDLVSVRVAVTNEATGVASQTTLYETEVGLMGFHGKPAVHFILARALSGSSQATQWKPNIAAAVEWHYTIREPGTWGKVWNWLYPGAGIHLASLDQGEDSVELGAGGVVSFWDGLLTGGFGYNFSNDSDHEYVFVGVNLLSLLQQGKKQFQTRLR